LLLLRLGLAIFIPYRSTGAVIAQSALDRLDKARKDFEFMRREREESLPLSEGSKEYLETFAEDHAR